MLPKQCVHPILSVKVSMRSIFSIFTHQQQCTIWNLPCWLLRKSVATDGHPKYETLLRCYSTHTSKVCKFASLLRSKQQRCCLVIFWLCCNWNRTWGGCGATWCVSDGIVVSFSIVPHFCLTWLLSTRRELFSHHFNPHLGGHKVLFIAIPHPEIHSNPYTFSTTVLRSSMMCYYQTDIILPEVNSFELIEKNTQDGGKVKVDLTQWVRGEQCILPCHLSILTHWTLCIYWFRHSSFFFSMFFWIYLLHFWHFRLMQHWALHLLWLKQRKLTLSHIDLNPISINRTFLRALQKREKGSYCSPFYRLLYLPVWL